MSDVSFDVSMKYGDKCVLFAVEGETTESNMCSLADYLSDACASLKKKSAILDCAGMRGSLDVTTLKSVGEYFSEKLRGNVTIYAFNMPKEWHHSQFAEDVMHNRGSFLIQKESLEELCDECERDCTPTDQLPV